MEWWCGSSDWFKTCRLLYSRARSLQAAKQIYGTMLVSLSDSGDDGVAVGMKWSSVVSLDSDSRKMRDPSREAPGEEDTKRGERSGWYSEGSVER